MYTVYKNYFQLFQLIMWHSQRLADQSKHSTPFSIQSAESAFLFTLSESGRTTATELPVLDTKTRKRSNNLQVAAAFPAFGSKHGRGWVILGWEEEGGRGEEQRGGEEATSGEEDAHLWSARLSPARLPTGPNPLIPRRSTSASRNDDLC